MQGLRWHCTARVARYVYRMYCYIFLNIVAFIVQINEASYIQNILNTGHCKSHMPEVMSQPISFEKNLYFPTFIVLEYCMLSKLLLIARNYNNDMALGYLAQLVMNPWNTCTRATGLGSIQILIRPYIFYNNHTIMFTFIGSCEVW